MTFQKPTLAARRTFLKQTLALGLGSSAPAILPAQPVVAADPKPERTEVDVRLILIGEALTWHLVKRSLSKYPIDGTEVLGFNRNGTSSTARIGQLRERTTDDRRHDISWWLQGSPVNYFEIPSDIRNWLHNRWHLVQRYDMWFGPRLNVKEQFLQLVTGARRLVLVFSLGSAESFYNVPAILDLAHARGINLAVVAVYIDYGLDQYVNRGKRTMTAVRSRGYCKEFTVTSETPVSHSPFGADDAQRMELYWTRHHDHIRQAIVRACEEVRSGPANTRA